MNHQTKVERTMSDMKVDRATAEETVRFLDWVTDEEAFLKSIHPAFKRDIDPDASFIQMCLALWNDESTGIRQTHMSRN